MHFTDVEMVEEDMFSVGNERDAYEDESSSVNETCLQTKRFICSQINQADPLAPKFNNLMLNGNIPRDRIFYRYLSDVLEMYLNPDHKYHPHVIEFFSTMMYSSGRRRFNFIRGPMCYGQASGFWDQQNVGKSKMNLGAPSESSCELRKDPSTTKSGTIKFLSLLQCKLINCDDSPEPMINNKSLLVYSCVYSNDGTALKPVVEFDVVSKTNVGLPVTVDMDFMKANTPPDPKMLSDLIITEAAVGIITSLDNKMSLPVSVTYSTKSGKSGEI